ncbi:MAG: ribonuclease J [Chloroflexi bacterium]|nr:ribonuclease J [Chloroflexota bacterium]
MAKKSKRPMFLKIIPLGGLGEVGKNMMLVEYGDDIIVIDVGLMFPEDEMLGVDLVLPDFSYVTENADRVRGVILTHGHEDHTGALPYLLKQINVPVYGTKLTLGLIEGKLAEHGLLKGARLIEIDPSARISLGVFDLEFIRVSHSIPDGLAIVLHTPEGIVIHSGDFKLDQTPIDGKVTEFGKIAAYHEQGVLALLSDSTNAEIEGYTMSEKVVGETLENIILNAKGRIVVASFASHIHRIQQIVDVAKRARRKIAICGRTMENNVEVASRLGYLNLPKKMIIHPSQMKDFLPSQILVLSTGTQGEPLSALARMSAKEHRWIQIDGGDAVIISASPVPGNEKSISQTINRLFRCGADVFYESISGVHVSGHAAREELKLLINMVNPKYFIPIHGELRQLTYHARIASLLGIPESNIFVAENGDVIELRKSEARMVSRVNAGLVLVDGLGVGDVGDVVLRDRRQLSQDGILIVVVMIDGRNGATLAAPELISRGFVYVRQSQDLLDEAKERVRLTLERTSADQRTDWAVLKNEIRRTLSDFIYEQIKRRPMIIPIILET